MVRRSEFVMPAFNLYWRCSARNNIGVVMVSMLASNTVDHVITVFTLTHLPEARDK